MLWGKKTFFFFSGLYWHKNKCKVLNVTGAMSCYLVSFLEAKTHFGLQK